MDEPVTHHNTSDDKQQCHVEHCRSELFQDSDFAQDPEHFKSNSGGILCIFESNVRSHSGMCKKQTSVSHSPTESEVASSDAGLRMDSLPGFDLWQMVNEVLHWSSVQTTPHRTHSMRTFFSLCVTFHPVHMHCKRWFRVDPPLCPGTSKGEYGSCTQGLVCVGVIVGKIREVSERELVLVVSVRCGKE